MVLESWTPILSTSASSLHHLLVSREVLGWLWLGDATRALWSPRQFPRQRSTRRPCPEFQVYDFRIYYGEISPLTGVTTPFPLYTTHYWFLNPKQVGFFVTAQMSRNLGPICSSDGWVILGAKNNNINGNLVEAAGIEPASENLQSEASTCLFRVLLSRLLDPPRTRYPSGQPA